MYSELQDALSKILEWKTYFGNDFMIISSGAGALDLIPAIKNANTQGKKRVMIYCFRIAEY